MPSSETELDTREGGSTKFRLSWPADQSVANIHAIARVRIEGLFGQYTYCLPSAGREDADLSRLFILYGGNGSGKTTLLKLIYHALSPEPNQGHRSFLAQTRFDRFAIQLFDGTLLEADRRVGEKGGSLLLTLQRGGRMLSGVEVDIDERLRVPGHERLKQRERLDEFLNRIRELNIRLYYLSDDRRHQGVLRESADRADKAEHITSMLIRARTLEHLTRFAGDMPEDFLRLNAGEGGDSVVGVTDRVAAWVQEEVRRGATKVEGDVYSIYSNVVRDIALLQTTSNNLEAESEELVSTLRSLAETSSHYSKYGLTPPLPVEDLIANIQQARSIPTTLGVIYNVMKPHVDGIRARFTATAGVYNTIHRLIQTINAFYKNKRVDFHVDRGFTILSGDEQLNPTVLSSGERQLMLLLCNTVLARQHASLFLIDEPELSLNVAWQRRLLQAVLENTEESSVQFLLATHSMELISQHRTSVVQLLDEGRHNKTSLVEEEPRPGDQEDS
jgi:energy-coupling factor transporter ATP-binding protein EcfA2